MKSIAIMQPYFFPYIGYFQLIKAVDLFVMYEDIQYTKKGWINRNRFLLNGKEKVFTLPLKKASSFLSVMNREISADFKKDRFLNQLREAYRQAPYFEKVFPCIEKIVLQNESNLFAYIRNSILNICKYLMIDTEIITSSAVQMNSLLRGKHKVMTICKSVDTDIYINPIGGQEMYSKQEFSVQGIELKFLKTKTIEYKQFSNEFVPWLSIIDVMMFNSVDDIADFLLSDYELV